jgi:hypothetical protein
MCLSLRLEHVDQSFLSELMFQKMVLKMTKYKDYKNDMAVKILNFFIFDKPQPPKLFTCNDSSKLLKLLSFNDCVA